MQAGGAEIEVQLMVIGIIAWFIDDKPGNVEMCSLPSISVCHTAYTQFAKVLVV